MKNRPPPDLVSPQDYSLPTPRPKHLSLPVAISEHATKCRRDRAWSVPCHSLKCLLLVKSPTVPNYTPFAPTLPFRMGLEALVESYAFWRPSLRTLTFEDIPGIPKQGNSVSWVMHAASH